MLLDAARPVAPAARAIIDACLRGELAAPLALVRLVAESPPDADLAAALAQRAADPLDDDARARLAELRRWHDDYAPRVMRIVGAFRESMEAGRAFASEAEGVATYARLFDWCVHESEAGSVALYSLGEPALLDRATAELVARLDAWGLLAPDRDVLDLGCGIGRLAAAIAPRVRRVLACDVSEGMVAAARRRCATLPGVRVERSSGLDLASVPDASYDLVCAIDVFPYLVRAGGALAARHVAEAARVLRPGGELVIGNYSYRGVPAYDSDDVHRHAAAAGLRIVADGVHPFTFWDAPVWRLRRMA